MNTFNTMNSGMISNIKTNTLQITKIEPINSNSVLLYFTNLSTLTAGSTYEYSFDGNTFYEFSPSQNKSPLNISNLTNNTDNTFYIRVVGTETISNAMSINFVGLTPFSFTSNIIISYSSCGLPSPTSTSYRGISATDYGNILIATNTGIYYSNNYGNTFTKSTNSPTNCISVSINNNGYALCCESLTGTTFANTIKLLYFSYNFGITWTKVTNATITHPSIVFMSQNGTSYVFNYPVDSAVTNNRIYRSNDYFSTTDNTSQTIYPANSHRVRLLNFASNGNGVTTGNNLPGYYFNNNFTTTTALTSRGVPGNAYAVGISENGRYLSAGTRNATQNPAENLSANFYDFGTTTPYSSLPNFTTKHIINNSTQNYAFVNLAPIGNNGICYMLLDYNLIGESTSAILYKYDFNTNIFTNLNIITIIGNYNSLVNTSPSGNYAVVCSYSTNIYILAP